ncbi:hypothetical protein BZA77DRAFT_314140, partial [Pyronema omphalodes]
MHISFYMRYSGDAFMLFCVFFISLPFRSILFHLFGFLRSAFTSEKKTIPLPIPLEVLVIFDLFLLPLFIPIQNPSMIRCRSCCGGFIGLFSL